MNRSGICFLAVCLLCSGRASGIASDSCDVIALVNELAEHELSEPQRKLLAEIEQAALDSIDRLEQRNAELETELADVREKSFRHPKTQSVYGANFIPEMIARIQENGERRSLQERSLSALAFDIDFFGKINTTFGHDGGDVLLERFIIVVETVLNEHLKRADDYYFLRTGGEEFYVFLVDVDPGYMVDIAESIRHMFSAHNLMFTGLERLPEPGGPIELEKDRPISNEQNNMTVSIGVARASREQGGDLESAVKDLMVKSDVALMKSKRPDTTKVQGRNLVTVHLADDHYEPVVRYGHHSN